MKNYFPHDHYARSDKKLINLIRVMGLAGIGLYWCIIEMLYEENGWLNISDLENIAYDLRTTPEQVNTLIHDFDLFYTRGEQFTSKSVQVRLKLMEAKSSQAAKAAKARWQKCKDDADAMRAHTISNALNKSKLNEIKEKESKGENSASLSTELLKEENSEGLTAKPEKPKEKSSAKKEKVQEHYFEQSPYFDRQKFLEAFTTTAYPVNQYPETDIAAYYESVKVWAEYGSGKSPGKQTSKDWLATARTFMKGDIERGKLKMKPLKQLQNGQPTYSNEQQQRNGAGPDVEAAVAMSRFLVAS